MRKHAGEVGRYIVNGLVATAVHYSVLMANLELLDFQSAGVANFVAALFGIMVSYFGSRYFVFKNTVESIISQASKFGILYGLIAILHGFVLFVWADWYAFSYSTGFLIATVLQVSLSYLGNKFLVFKK
ncbi:hypothetical protein GCM10011450_27200 [Advenella faeciporci]|uniref:GtrA/DPMS transmembrane domain-containing protein n=1 Tax=Advenella faeciporci TaxID=797535 RepID=A0A918JR19_9BURK|nr:GtrA family protein [Advenella faeciporci]GGW96155.1 hypothetical protein GCM10011450_27200 [Advenella faeciporci]